MAIERIQKALARAGVASRRKIETLVARRQVTINGEVAQPGDKVDLEVDHVRVDGKRIQPLRRPQLYLLLNKPPGYVSTVSDPEGRPTVLDLLPSRLHKALFPVGRLDFESEGLLLLTTDGAFAQKIAHPSSGCTKVYEVKAKGHLDEGAIARLQKGVMLYGRQATPAWIESFGGPPGRRTGRDNSWFRIALKEGRTRQIREMFFRIGHPVMRLKRTAIGGFSDPYLRIGSFRHLEPAEVEKLLAGSEPVRRVERTRGRAKVKLDAKTEGVSRPGRRRAAAEAAALAAASAAVAPGSGKSAPAQGQLAAGKGRSAPPDSPRRTSFKVTRPTQPARSFDDDEDDEWEWEGSAPPSATPRSTPSSTSPPRQERPLFEESEYAPRQPSLLYGDDDESWDEPLAGKPAAARGRAPYDTRSRSGEPRRGPRPDGRGGRPDEESEWGNRPTNRPPARAGRPPAGRPPTGRPAMDRPPGGRPPAGRPPGGRPSMDRPPGGRPPAGRPSTGRPSAGRPPAGRPPAGRPYGSEGDSGYRSDRSGYRPEGRPSARPADGRPGDSRPSARPSGRPGARPEGRFEGRPDRRPADRPAAGGGERGERDERSSRPRTGAGLGGRPSSRPGERPPGRSSGRPDSQRYEEVPARPKAGKPGERPASWRPGTQSAGKAGGRPGGKPGGRPSGGRPGGRPGGKPGGGPSRPGAGGGRPGGGAAGKGRRGKG